MGNERGNYLKRFLDRYIGIPLVFLTSCLRLHKKNPPKTIKHIGILCFGAIGDLLLLSGLINGLNKKYPDALITLIVSKANSSVISLIPCVNNHKAFKIEQIFSIILYLRFQQFDVLFDSSQWARFGAILSNLSGAKCIIGFKTHNQYRHYGYDYVVNHSSNIHEIENFMNLGKVLDQNFIGEPKLLIPSCSVHENVVHIEKNQRPSVFLHMWPSGLKSYLKEWPMQHWADLATKLENCGYEIYFTGSLADQIKTKNFLNEYLSDKNHIHSVAGKLSIQGLAYLFKKSKVVISVNTGIMHLAALVGAITIGLHGPTNPRRWGPVGENAVSLLPRDGEFAYLNLGFEYPKNAYNSLKNLSVDDVITVLCRLNLM